MTQQERLVKQFEIAVKVLEEIRDYSSETSSVMASVALRDIEDLNPCNHEFEPFLKNGTIVAKCRLCNKLFKEIK